jgi:hypothetical protein
VTSKQCIHELAILNISLTIYTVIRNTETDIKILVREHTRQWPLHGRNFGQRPFDDGRTLGDTESQLSLSKLNIYKVQFLGNDLKDT